MNADPIFIGKNILRLVTTAMYSNPLTLYREYIQNAVDGIDAARADGLHTVKPVIDIAFDYRARAITIRDTGAGIPADEFAARMVAIGWSDKPQESMRGLWGIGRFVGLAYCKRLVFRTKAAGEDVISCIEWDGQKLRALLAEANQKVDLSTLITQVTELTAATTEREQPSFFEVQVNGVVRHGNDALFNQHTVREYISQVAPVPFHSDAPYREQLVTLLTPHVDVAGYHILLNGMPQPICKPHKPEFAYSANCFDHFSGMESIEINNRRDELVAVGWILQHSYLGALKNNPAIRGLRVRSGNMQIGSERILVDIFPEERFNSWSVGELHILDPNVRPNGQRSYLEDTPTFRDIKNKLVPIGRAIAQKCRANSAARNAVNLMLKRLGNIAESLNMIEANMFSSTKAHTILANLKQEVALYQSQVATFSNPLQNSAADIITRILQRIAQFENDHNDPSPLDDLPRSQQTLVQGIAGLIYDHAGDPRVAEQLIQQIQSFIQSRPQ